MRFGPSVSTIQDPAHAEGLPNAPSTREQDPFRSQSASRSGQFPQALLDLNKANSGLNDKWILAHAYDAQQHARQQSQQNMEIEPEQKCDDKGDYAPPQKKTKWTVQQPSNQLAKNTGVKESKALYSLPLHVKDAALYPYLRLKDLYALSLVNRTESAHTKGYLSYGKIDQSTPTGSERVTSILTTRSLGSDYQDYLLRRMIVEGGGEAVGRFLAAVEKDQTIPAAHRLALRKIVDSVHALLSAHELPESPSVERRLAAALCEAGRRMTDAERHALYRNLTAEGIRSKQVSRAVLIFKVAIRCLELVPAAERAKNWLPHLKFASYPQMLPHMEDALPALIRQFALIPPQDRPDALDSLKAFLKNDYRWPYRKNVLPALIWLAGQVQTEEGRDIIKSMLAGLETHKAFVETSWHEIREMLRGLPESLRTTAVVALGERFSRAIMKCSDQSPEQLRNFLQVAMTKTEKLPDVCEEIWWGVWGGLENILRDREGHLFDIMCETACNTSGAPRSRAAMVASLSLPLAEAPFTDQERIARFWASLDAAKHIPKEYRALALQCPASTADRVFDGSGNDHVFEAIWNVATLEHLEPDDNWGKFMEDFNLSRRSNEHVTNSADR